MGRVRVRVRVSGGRAGSREGSTRCLDAVCAALRRPLGRSQLGGSQGLFGRVVSGWELSQPTSRPSKNLDTVQRCTFHFSEMVVPMPPCEVRS